MVLGTDQDSQTDVTLGDEEKETPKEELTHTQAQVDEAERQGQNKALADIGRLTKESERAVKAATAAQERTKKLLKELEDDDLERAKGNSELRSEQEVREMHKRRQAENELEDAKSELTQRDEELSRIREDSAKATKSEKAREIATRLNVDADKLIKLSKFTDGSAEAMEELAKELPQKQVRATVVTDSGGGGGGGGGTFTLAQIDNMPDDEYMKNKDAIDKARMEGKIKH